MTVETLQRIVRHFKEHRQAPRLRRTEEDIHAFEKNQMEELCIKAKSLIEKCDRCAKKQYDLFHRFYSKAVSTRRENDSLDRELASLERRRTDFEKHFKEMLEELTRACQEVLDSRQVLVDVSLPRTTNGATCNGMDRDARPRMTNGTTCNGMNRDAPRHLLEQVNAHLKHGLDGLKKEIQVNSNMLKMSGTLLDDLKHTSNSGLQGILNSSSLDKTDFG